MNNDLISRSALCGKQEEMYIHTDSGKIIPAMAIPVWVINNAPAIDAALVRHGRWIANDDGFGGEYYTCSACNEDWFIPDGTPAENRMNFCPCCGAKMDTEEDTNG